MAVPRNTNQRVRWKQLDWFVVLRGKQTKAEAINCPFKTISTTRLIHNGLMSAAKQHHRVQTLMLAAEIE